MTQNNQPVKPILLEVKEITKVFGGTAVSYTHLDVYKRQGSGLDSGILKNSGTGELGKGNS